MESGPGGAFNVSVMVMSLVSFITFIVLTYADLHLFDPCCVREDALRKEQRQYELTVEAWELYDDQVLEYQVLLAAYSTATSDVTETSEAETEAQSVE